MLYTNIIFVDSVTGLSTSRTLLVCEKCGCFFLEENKLHTAKWNYNRCPHCQEETKENNDIEVDFEIG